MLKRIRIENFKSVKEVTVEVGRFNVIIGENGAGKSNFLESIASYSAIIANSFTNEFMLSRGIRVVEPLNILSCFKEKQHSEECNILVIDDDGYACNTSLKFNPSEPFSPLSTDIQFYRKNFKDDFEVLDINELGATVFYSKLEEIASNYNCSVYELKQKILNAIVRLQVNIKEGNSNDDKDIIDKEVIDKEVIEMLHHVSALAQINKIYDDYHNKEKEKNTSFIIYSPELSSLRTFFSESQIEPLGINGEGLLKLLQVMQEHEPANFEKVCEIVAMFQWVEKIIIESDSNNLEQRIKIIDRFMGKEIDHRSANEGFLFVLFYATLFSSKYTPKSFAVNNIDASLNPKLCRVLIKELVKLAKENDKQAFVTTHNPAILDGLDLHDDEQRLFVVERNDEGSTQLRRVGVDDLPKPKRNGETIKLSEAFMRGHLGGLPTNF